MVRTEEAVVVVVDVQGKLADLMWERDRLYESLQRLIRGMKTLAVPLLWCEQNPAKMGPTVEPVRQGLLPLTPIPKMSFSCWGEPLFRQQLQATGRRHVLLAGIETHVCILQTATDLLAEGCRVSVVADAVSSRSAEHRRLGLELARQRGAEVTSVETALFEGLRTAAHPAFRDILALVR